jgi:hypothetical protein
MVTENEMAESVVDEITQTQQQLDQEQGIPAEQPAGAPTPAELAMQEQVRSLQSQVSGLQSKYDMGLNAIRRDTENWAKEQISSLQGQLARDRWMEGLDENDKQLVSPMMERIQQLEALVQGMAPQQQPPQEMNPAAAWEGVYQYVESAGINRNDPNLRYDILTNTSLPDDQRRNQFIAHLQQLRGAVSNQTPAAQTPSQQPPATPNPPIESPSGTQGSMTRDQIMDLYIGNQLGTANDPSGHGAYRELMAKNGFQIDS